MAGTHFKFMYIACAKLLLRTINGTVVFSASHCVECKKFVRQVFAIVRMELSHT